jgi:hypothetical protein
MQVTLSDDNLILEFSAVEKICSCRRSVEVSVEHIAKVRPGVPEPRLLEVRVPGTFIPGVIKAGTYWTRTGKEFWYVRRGMPRYVTIEMVEDAPFRRMVLGLDEGEHVFLKDLKKRGVDMCLEDANVPVEINA